jgi:hypothetical protein
MGGVIELLEWRNRQTGDRVRPSDRLERAVERLDAAASRALEDQGRLQPWVETELLAILGAVFTELTDQAADRAERLARKLEAGAAAAGR